MLSQTSEAAIFVNGCFFALGGLLDLRLWPQVCWRSSLASFEFVKVVVDCPAKSFARLD